MADDRVRAADDLHREIEHFADAVLRSAPDRILLESLEASRKELERRGFRCSLVVIPPSDFERKGDGR